MVYLADAKNVAKHIADSITPVCIVVFGSVAKTGKGNDLDLLIVADDNEIDLNSLNIEIRSILKPFYEKISIDPFVTTLSTLKKYFIMGSPFLRLIQREGRCLYMKDSLFQWFNQAKEDLAMAECLLKNNYYRGACYNSQQAIEKTFKGILIKQGWELEKTHNLRFLVSLSKRYGISITILDDDIDFIDSIYRGRYPAEEGLLPTGEPTKNDALKAINIANSVVQEIIFNNKQE
ncbi:HEPN domain-containing protein [Candidatus Poribacteria bacterium]|nr:HEPN domain-containing protein [Candidatus Poribacteria bacterium]